MMSDLKVFISRGGSHDGWAERFSGYLASRGVDTWVTPEDLRDPEDPRARAMEKALREFDILVALVTPENVDRRDFNFEIGVALAAKKPIVSVVPRGFDRSQLPDYLRRRKQIVMDTPEKTAEALLLSKAAA